MRHPFPKHRQKSATTIPQGGTSQTARLFFTAAWAFVIFLISSVYAQSPIDHDVSRTPPDSWKRFEAQLTPIERALKLPEVTPRRDAAPYDMEVVLSETFTLVDEDGKSLSVLHRIYKLLSEEGRDDFANRTYPVGRNDRYHVVTAETISPDGERHPVEAEGLFIEAEPQQDIHTDRRTLNLLFPKAEVGSVARLVLVVEEEHIVPGQWTDLYSGLAKQPIRRKRTVVECSETVASTLAFHGFDMDFKAERSPANTAGDVHFEVVSERLRPFEEEIAMPNVFSPLASASTQRDWTAVGQWFAQLLASLEPTKEDQTEEERAAEKRLQTLAVDWAGSATTKMEIARNLYRKVAEDVRYVGLEFGDGAYCPRAPSLVAKTEYGDCKDKSNLLRKLLGYHGIESDICLVGPGPGRIPENVPDLRFLNHAVLAIDLEKTTWFCDPTAPFLPFGSLSPLQSKNLLRIGTDGTATWVEAPLDTANSFQFKGALEVTHSGAFSGWVELRIEGSIGHATAWGDDQRANQNSDFKQALNSYFKFVPGLSIVDAEDLPAADQPFARRYYLVQRPEAVRRSGENQLFFRPPTPRGLLHVVGPEQPRKYDYATFPKRVGYDFTVKLPPNWRVSGDPPSFDSQTDHTSAAAIFRNQTNGFQMTATSDVRTDRIPRREFKDFADNVRAMVKWIDTGLQIDTSAGEEAQSDWAVDPATLPKMPTSEGFERLVSLRFPMDQSNPLDADHRQRARAFERMAELYPDVPRASFLRELSGVIGDLLHTPSDNMMRRQLNRMKKVRKEFAGEVGANEIAAMDVTIAGFLMDLGKSAEVIELCERVVADEEVDEPVRLFAGALLAAELSEDDPDRAASLMKKAMSDESFNVFHWDMLGAVYLDAIARDSTPNDKQLVPEMKWMVDTYPGDLEGATVILTITPELLIRYGHQTEAKELIRMLSGDAFADILSDFDREYLAEDLSGLDFAEPHLARLLAHLETHPWPNLDVLAKKDSHDNALTFYEDFNVERKNWDLEARYGLRALSGYGAQPDFVDWAIEFCEMVATWDKPRNARDKAAFEAAERIVEEVLWPAWMAHAKQQREEESFPLLFREEWLRSQGKEKQARQFLDRAIRNEEFSAEARTTCVNQVLEMREDSNDLAGFIDALALGLTVEKRPEERLELLGTQVYLLQFGGKEAQAWTALTAGTETEFEDEVAEELLDAQARWTDMLTDRDDVSKHWASTTNWWPHWTALAERLNIEEKAWSDLGFDEIWDSPLIAKLSAEKLEKQMRKGKANKQRKRIKRALPSLMWHSRIYPDGVPLSRTALRVLAELVPAENAAMDELLKNLPGGE